MHIYEIETTDRTMSIFARSYDEAVSLVTGWYLMNDQEMPESFSVAQWSQVRIQRHGPTLMRALACEMPGLGIFDGDNWQIFPIDGSAIGEAP